MSMKYVGIFWYVEEKNLLLCDVMQSLAELSKKNKQSNLHGLIITTSATFEDLWKSYRKVYGLKHSRATTYPRGRVSYLQAEGVFEIRLAKVLHDNIMVRNRIAIRYKIPLAQIKWVVDDNLQ